jgi:hypothetical protein
MKLAWTGLGITLSNYFAQGPLPSDVIHNAYIRARKSPKGINHSCFDLLPTQTPALYFAQNAASREAHPRQSGLDIRVHPAQPRMVAMKRIEEQMKDGERT